MPGALYPHVTADFYRWSPPSETMSLIQDGQSLEAPLAGSLLVDSTKTADGDFGYFGPYDGAGVRSGMSHDDLRPCSWLGAGEVAAIRGRALTLGELPALLAVLRDSATSLGTVSTWWRWWWSTLILRSA